MSRKVAISNRQEPTLQEDNEWKEYVIAKVDINESLLRIIYDRDDVGFVLDYISNDKKMDKRRKNIYFYSNEDIDGLKNFMQYLDYDQTSPKILE